MLPFRIKGKVKWGKREIRQVVDSLLLYQIHEDSSLEYKRPQ